MARIFGTDFDNLTNITEVRFYEDIVSRLPDYIYAGFGIMIGNRESDCIIIIPHVGVFVIEVRGYGLQVIDGVLYRTSRNGDVIGEPRLGVSRTYTMQLRHELRERFGFLPFVAAVEYMPNVHLTDEIRECIDNMGFCADNIISADDIASGAGFLARLHRIYVDTLDEYNMDAPGTGDMYARSARSAHGLSTEAAVDLSDAFLEKIVSIWDEDIIRAQYSANAVKLFLGYVPQDRQTAEWIKEYIEHKSGNSISVELYHIADRIHSYHEANNREAMLEKMADCDGFILLLSRYSQDNNMLQYAMMLAQDNGLKVFPLKIGDFDMSELNKTNLSHIQWKQCANGYLDEIVEVLKSVDM